MAAALFVGRTAGHVDHPDVASAGLGPAGLSVPDEVLEAMARRGSDLTAHRSITLTLSLIHI